MLAVCTSQITRTFNVDAKRYFLQVDSDSTVLETITNTGIKSLATEFLSRKDLYQIVRREICFGLIPKTLKRKLEFVFFYRS